MILIASGSEVEIALEAQKKLKNINIESKVVSMPCQELFDLQSDEYKNKILDEDCLKITIEAGSTSCWGKYLNNNSKSIGIDSFGASAPYKEVYEHFNLTSDKIALLAQEILRK